MTKGKVLSSADCYKVRKLHGDKQTQTTNLEKPGKHLANKLVNLDEC